MWNLTVKEKQAVLALEPFKRYAYTIKRIADTEVVYSAQHEDGTWALSYLDDHTLLPIWPHAEFARPSVENEWAGYNVVEIPLREFTDSFLPVLKSDLLINVFGVDHRTGFVVNQQELLRDLKKELSKY